MLQNIYYYSTEFRQNAVLQLEALIFLKGQKPKYVYFVVGTLRKNTATGGQRDLLDMMVTATSFSFRMFMKK